MQTDYAGQTIPVIDPAADVIYTAQICRGPGRLHLTFAFASSSPKLPDWIEARCERSPSSAASPKRSWKADVVKALWFDPTLNATFAAMAEHYDTTILPTRSRKPRPVAIFNDVQD